MEKKTSTILNAVLSIVVFLLLVLAGQMTWQQFGERSIDTVSPLLANDGVSGTTPAEDEITISNGIQTFTSKDLGIRFRVRQSADQNSGPFVIQRWGQKVLVGLTSIGINNGQSVHVFEKGAEEDLVSAVNRQFLRGIPTSDCTATITGPPTSSSKIGSTFQVVQIQLPTPVRGDPEMMIAAAERCPDRYTTTNGVAYFITDANHPTQFAFFDIGQYPIEAEQGVLWQDTLEFLK